MTQDRKADHIRICLNEDVGFKNKSTGFENYSFIHQALPDINMSDIDLSLNLFDKVLNYPVIIESMTGGTELSFQINENLAIAAQKLRVGMMVGSQRISLEQPSLAYTFQVRHTVPDALLIANIGAIQLNNGFDYENCLDAISMIGADALALHLNPLQEAIQYEGNTNFRGLLENIKKLRRKIEMPIIVKEVGCGISKEVASRLVDAGVDCIDIGGAGGTSWAMIESYRAKSDCQRTIGDTFSDWGIPTAESLNMVKSAVPDIPVIASGGIRNGVDAAKAIALGASVIGIALPLLSPALESPLLVENVLNRIIEELKIAMFCTGSANLKELGNTKYLVKK
ncbi:type 2 isopentenyl-diphosphate Delta-isomerase [Candidatus Poribacteria bacterium]|nr:type 2 isopentenyl-diphosphate Delta-isomerase [Candidatus Poribacteria bacterium]